MSSDKVEADIEAEQAPVEAAQSAEDPDKSPETAKELKSEEQLKSDEQPKSKERLTSEEHAKSEVRLGSGEQLTSKPETEEQPKSQELLKEQPKSKEKLKTKARPKSKEQGKGKERPKTKERAKSKDRLAPGSGKKRPKQPTKKKDEEAAAAVSDESQGVPEYIVPLVLTKMTQEIFDFRVDVDATAENPYKLIQKEDILEDLKAREAISDFHPVKKLITDYPGEELLLVFDSEFKYGQNFYLVTTEEWKEKILNPPEPQEEEEVVGEEVVQEYVYKAPVSKAWVSFGSEVEIEEEKLHENPHKIKYMVSRVRREFGAPISFSDQNPSNVKDGYIECTSYEDKHFSISLRERDTATQVVPETTNNSTQTSWTHPRNACTQYEPRQFPEEEAETILSSKSIKDFLNSVTMRLELALQQNEIMDPFFNDWKFLAEDDTLFGGKSDSHLKEYQSFTDLLYSKDKSISCINWHPYIQGLLAVSVMERLSFEERLNVSGKLLLTPSLIIFWSFSDPIHPQLMLESPDDMYCFQFCPTDSNIIAGGCLNGQVVMWDISEYEDRLNNTKTVAPKNVAPKSPLEIKVSTETPIVRYCALSAIESGHKAVITDLHWLPEFYEISKAGEPCESKDGLCLQLVTCSPDCSILFWDIRPPKPPAKPTSDRRKSEEGQFDNPVSAVPTTFTYLDLVWKPMFRLTLPRFHTSGDYSPMRISLRDEFTTYRMIAPKEKTHSFIDNKEKSTKEGKTEPTVHYVDLKVASAKTSKVLDDLNTNVFSGTEDGELVYSNWKMEKDSDTGRMMSPKPFYSYKIHDGMVNTVQRSPFFKDIILSVGGWSFAIWKEAVGAGPIIHSCCAPIRYTTGHWSLSRAGVFFIGKEDGNIDIWDLLEKTHEPSQTQNISPARITCLKPWVLTPKQHFLATADDNGTLHILEIPWTLRNPSRHETTIVQNYFEREVKHMEYSEQRKAIRLEEKAELDLKASKKKAELPQPHKSASEGEEIMRKEYLAFLALEKLIMTQLEGKTELKD